MKSSILLFSSLLTATGATTAGDSKVLLQKALFAEEVEQNKAKAIDFYQRLIDQEGERPKQIAVARYHLAKLKLDAGEKEEASALLQALIASPDAPAPLVAQAKELIPGLEGNAEKMRQPDSTALFELLKDKIWDWHYGSNLLGEPKGSFRFLADGKIEATFDKCDLIGWIPQGNRRVRIIRDNGEYYVFELSQENREALALNLPGVVDATKRLALHPTSASTIEAVEIEFLQKIIAEQPDDLAAFAIPHDLAHKNRTRSLGFLIDHGIPVDLHEKKDWLWTPLFTAVKKADIATIKFLLDRGADVNALDIRNAPPLFVAVERGDREIVKLLLDRGANVHTTSSWINPGDRRMDLGTALHVAAQRGQLPIASLLLDRGAGINDLSPKLNQTPLIDALAVRNMELAKELLKRGANPNIPESGISNALRQVAYQGNAEMLRQLLAHGARTDMQSSEIQSSFGVPRTVGAALPAAVREGNLEVSGILVEAGCPVDQITPQYLETPLHAASLHGNTAMCKWLLEKGANANHRLADNVGTQSGWTPLHSAAWRGSLEVAELLMTKGASPTDACGDAGMRRTPFHLAVLKGWIPIVRTMMSQPAYQNPDARKQLLASADLQGNTALHLAVSREAMASAEMVKFLIESGAPLEITNARNLTPAQLCIDPKQGTRDDAVRSLFIW